MNLEVLFTPADFAALKQRDLSETVCVVFDILRATSTMVTALSNGAEALIPVQDISEALAFRRKWPEVLLAGERNGLRIPAALTGSIPFDLGNSPREFTQAAVRGRAIVITTTNGTRALRACDGAKTVLAASFLNLEATAAFLSRSAPENLVLVCSGTFEEAAYEDILGAGALCDLVWNRCKEIEAADSAHAARRLFSLEREDLYGAVAGSRNGRRLLANPDLRDDVACCVRRNWVDRAAILDAKGRVTFLPESSPA